MSFWPIILLGLAILFVSCASTGQRMPTKLAGSSPITPSLPTSTAEVSPSPQSSPTAVPMVSPVPTPLPPFTATPQTPLTAVARPTRPVPAGGSPEASVPPEATAAVNQARQQLSTQTNIPVDQIQVVNVSKVQWPTSALGCPQPGRMYAQVVTPGYRIVLAAAGRTYEYHSDSGRRVVNCTAP